MFFTTRRKRFWLAVVLLLTIPVSFIIFSSPDMSTRQKILKWLYPAFMKAQNLGGSKGKILVNEQERQPPAPLPLTSIVLNDGKSFDPATLKGRKLLLVNTASDCGYTAQYETLQQLADKYPDQLLVIAFPANDFRNQEKGDDASIAAFCQRNYGLRLPLAKKCQVIKGDQQHPVFSWLSHANQNGWCEKAPEWNFSKYLVNEKGILTHYFAPGVSPMDEAVMKAILQ